jgi:hypothetical protein
MKSLGQMIKQLDGLRGTQDINEWESDFIKSVVGWTGNGERTTGLSSKQIAVIERLYRKHFA